MNPLYVSIAALVITAAVLLHGVLASRRYQRGLALTQARYDKHRHTSTENLDRAKRQIGQLQEDLSTARQEIKRLTRDRSQPAARPAATAAQLHAQAQAKQDLLHVLIDKPPRHVPVNGFADTLPSRQFEESGVLMR